MATKPPEKPTPEAVCSVVLSALTVVVPLTSSVLLSPTSALVVPLLSALASVALAPNSSPPDAPVALASADGCAPTLRVARTSSCAALMLRSIYIL